MANKFAAGGGGSAGQTMFDIEDRCVLGGVVFIWRILFASGGLMFA